MTDRQAIRALPALRASLLWYKRRALEHWRERAAAATRPLMRTHCLERAERLRATPLAKLRQMYLTDRVTEINRAPLAELRAVARNPVTILTARIGL